MSGETNGFTETAALPDDIGQLRSALASASNEISILRQDRAQLQARLTAQSASLQHMADAHNSTLRQQDERSSFVQQRHHATKEELRVAMDELQTLTAKLETANETLRNDNRNLDRRVADRTHQIKQAHAALQISEASFRAVTELVPDLLWRADRHGDWDWCNKRWHDYTGMPARRNARPDWAQSLHPADKDAVLASWQVAVGTQTPFLHECRLRDAAGKARWFLVRAEALRDVGGEVLQWFGTCTDVHDHRISFDALQASERRFRNLVEGVPQLVWRGLANGEWTWASPQWCRLTGQAQDGLQGQGWKQAIHPEDRDGAELAWQNAKVLGALDFNARVRVCGDGYRQYRFMASPVSAEDGSVIEWLGTATDINATHLMHQQQRMLVAELQHRTRNLIAVIHSVADGTLRRCDTLGMFATKFRDRLGALARVQGLLSRLGENDRVSFDELLRAELSAHGALDDGQAVMLAGPPGIRLRSGSVQILALALHELATNALKHGALSQQGACLSVDWRLHADDDRSQLCVQWQETGVRMHDKDVAQTRVGQGRELIERALPYQLGAITTYVLGDDGVRCTIDLPISTTISLKEAAHG